MVNSILKDWFIATIKASPRNGNVHKNISFSFKVEELNSIQGQNLSHKTQKQVKFNLKSQFGKFSYQIYI
jgi:hypothetical protein